MVRATEPETSARGNWRWLVVLPTLFVEYVAISIALMVGEGITIYGHDDGDPLAGVVIGVVGSLPLVASVWFAGGWIAVGCLGALAGVIAISWVAAAISPVLFFAVVAVGLLAGRWTLRNI